MECRWITNLSSFKFSIWPCYFIVNELPYRMRLLKENWIIGGLWFGEEKPNMHVFLKPIETELLKLEKVGIEVMPPLSPAPFIAKVILLAGTCDLPAKCLMPNAIQFNGKFGCNKCLQSQLVQEDMFTYIHIAMKIQLVH